MIESGLSVGIEYSEIMKLDNKRLFVVYRGKMKYLERTLNNTDYSNRVQAIKISQALFDSKGFNENNKPLRLLRESTLEKAARIATADGISREVIRKNILGGE